MKATDRRSALLGACATGLSAGLPWGRIARADIPYAGASEMAEGLDQLRSLVILEDGVVVLSKAFRGPAPNRPVNVKSVSKTIVALLTGIAIGRGLLSGPGVPIGEVAPRLIPRGADPRVASIRVDDLLTMRAGLERTSGPNYGEWIGSPNWVRHVLSRPFVAEPGERFLYSTGSFHVLGAVLSTVARASLLDLARDWLGRPLGIAIPPWTRDPQGFYMGGNNMAISPLGLARIGEMVRQGGVWEGRQVVPRRWIETSWEPRTRSPWSGDEYGYGWFLRRLGGEFAAYGRGYGGQMLYVVPERRLTVAITSDPTRPARTGGHVGDLHRLLAERIIGAGS